MEETGNCKSNSNHKHKLTDSQTTTITTTTTIATDFSYDSDTKLLSKVEKDLYMREYDRKTEFVGEFQSMQQRHEDLLGFVPVEVYERNLLRTSHLKTGNNEEMPSKQLNTLQIPEISVPGVEKRPADHIFTSDSYTIIDTDVQDQRSSSDEQGEASDILSAISNEECSVTSEILDKPSDFQSNAADILQVSFLFYLPQNSN